MKTRKKTQKTKRVNEEKNDVGIATETKYFGQKCDIKCFVSDP